MVILANQHRSSNEPTRNPLKSTECDTTSVKPRLATQLEAGSFLPAYMRGEMTSDIRRTLSLSLTLTHWTPLARSQGLLESTTALDGTLTTNISSSPHSLITSAAVLASPTARPLTAREPEPRASISVVESQHTTDRFPRFTYLLRNGTLKPELDEGRSRRSADPGGAQASVATLPDALAQCGVGNETGLQSCAAASPTGTLAALPLAERPSSPSRASTLSPVPADILASASVKQSSQDDPESRTVPSPDTAPAMANHSRSTSASRGGARTEHHLASTRRGATDRERITAESSSSQLSFSSNNQSQSRFQSGASTPYADAADVDGDADADADENDHDESQQGQDAQNQPGAQTAEGQPRKKKTRRAGVAITRVRRMQREVRRLAEEEEVSAAQRQQPGRSLLLGAQLSQPQPIQPPSTLHGHGHHGLSGNSTIQPLPLGLASVRQYPGLPLAMSPPPRSTLTSPVNLNVGPLARPPSERPARSESASARGPGYDSILEDGDDVVLLRLPPAGPSTSIWAIRPEERERPRGSST